MNTIIKLKTNDLTFFNQMYNDYSAKLYDFIYMKTNSEFYANEVVQMTFIKLWKSREELKNDVPMGAQIFQMAKSTLIDVLRKTEKERIKINSFAESREMEKTSGNELINGYNAKRILEDILKQMPPMRQKVFNLRIQHFSYKEIACTLSISVKTVNKHLELARKQLEPYLNVLFVLLFFFVK
ncbi:hypothetical protein A9P82_11755 [Arachidicoccus ginsenosidimutans]|uniref:RNA polymerase sigma factor n=1 Tax=Arachidicoccus sp. BS20 TaxID=1850526 RepID=UPI0007F1564B|nr:sigma-70 family RNA polymerase sigma factor [Arachidicoccus sp. BS20]ANI89900.1 hypothetical protein A9P82_11755 [Arachidicoccus sp. BS20]